MRIIAQGFLALPAALGLLVLSLSLSSPLTHPAWAETSVLEQARAASERGDFTEAARLYRQAAEAGDPDAQNELGVMYRDGRGLPPSTVAAAEWFHRAAEQRHADASVALSELYREGRGVAKNPDLAFEWQRQAAIRGHAGSQYALAEQYKSGDRVVRDRGTAMRWLRRAAEQGYGKAQCGLGEAYHMGFGIPQNYVLAYMWYELGLNTGDCGRKAERARQEISQRMTPARFDEAQEKARTLAESIRARQSQSNQPLPAQDLEREAEDVKRLLAAIERGDASAQYALGKRYEEGRGVPLDLSEAVGLYSRAAEQGDIKALLALAFFHHQGVSGSYDRAEAARLYRLAAEQGSGEAQYLLGRSYERGWGLTEDHTEAAKWYRLAAEQENTDAQVALGTLYGWGRGVAQSNEEGLYWYRRAAEQGHALGQHALGEMYLGGAVVEQDEAEAIRLNRLAAEQGDPYALWRLGTLYKNGVGVSQDKVRAHMWFNLAGAMEYGAAGFLGELPENMTADEVTEAQARAVAWFEAFQARQADLQDGLSDSLKFGSAESDAAAIESSRYSLTGSDEDVRAKLQAFAARRTQAEGERTGEGQAMTPEQRAKAGENALTRGDFAEAAEQGNTDAQFLLGVLSFAGQGADRNEAEGVRWLRQAAEQGHAQAQVLLGGLYKEGRGVPQSDTEATKWFDRAKRQLAGDPSRLDDFLSAEEQSAPEAFPERIAAYRADAEAGDAMAQFALGIIYKEGMGDLRRDAEQARTWWRKAAEQGIAEAQVVLAKELYNNSNRIPQDFSEPLKWFRAAAEQGNVEAQGFLAVMYRFGQGQAPDAVMARKWFLIAERLGNREAARLGPTFASTMTAVEISEAERHAENWLADFRARQGDEE